MLLFSLLVFQFQHKVRERQRMAILLRGRVEQRGQHERATTRGHVTWHAARRGHVRQGQC